MNEERFYSEEEAEAILREASRIDSPSSRGMSNRDLVAAAQEMGIDATAIQEAEQRVLERRDLEKDRIEFEVSRRSKMREEISSYVSVSLLLIGINLFTTGFSLSNGKLWLVWPVGIWGLVVLGNLIQHWMNRGNNQEQEFQKWREKKRIKASLVGSFLPSGVRQTRVDALLDHYFTVHDTDDKIGAIKTVREQTGLALKESKMLVDEYCHLRGLS